MGASGGGLGFPSGGFELASPIRPLPVAFNVGIPPGNSIKTSIYNYNNTNLNL